MGYFHRHPGQGPGQVDVSVDEFRAWIVDDPEPSPYQQALADVERDLGRNLVVVLDHTGVIATVAESEHGAVWRSVLDDRAAGPGAGRDVPTSVVHELLEWDGERARPLRLIAALRDEPAYVELDPEPIVAAVEIARTTTRLQRIHVAD